MLLDRLWPGANLAKIGSTGVGINSKKINNASVAWLVFVHIIISNISTELYGLIWNMYWQHTLELDKSLISSVIDQDL